MSDVRVSCAHNLGVEGAKAALKPFEAELSKYNFKLEWSGSNAELKGVGASGRVDIQADKVVITLKLGLLAKAAGLKPEKLQASIEKRLQSALA